MKRTLLAPLVVQLLTPDTRAAALEETGDPTQLTRHAIDVEDGQIVFLFDTVNGPQKGGTELMDVAVFPEATDDAMLVTSQRYTPEVKAVLVDGSMDQIGQGIHAKYKDAREVKLSSLGDPELDGKSGIYFYAKDEDGKYIVTGVGKKIQGYTLDGDRALVYQGETVFLVDTTDLLDALRNDGLDSIAGFANESTPIGEGAKMARAGEIEIAGETKKVWAYTQRAEGETKGTIFYLDAETLETLAFQEFDGNYATFSQNGAQMVVVGRTIDEDGEKFPVVFHDSKAFTALATPKAIPAPEAQA